MAEKKVTFKATPSKKIYEKEGYKIYAMNVNTEEYPDIKLNAYKPPYSDDVIYSCSIKGELPTLTTGLEYTITAIEEVNNKGVSYKVKHITTDMDLSGQAVYDFLCNITSEGNAYELYTKYPNILKLVENKETDTIDTNKLRGIGEIRLNQIVANIKSELYIFELIKMFRGFIPLTVLKKLYNKFSSTTLLKMELAKNPYSTLLNIKGIGFNSADNILLEMEESCKEDLLEGKEPVINFPNDLKTSEDRCLGCMMYLLLENQNNGNTKMPILELKKNVEKLVPSAKHHFVNILKKERGTIEEDKEPKIWYDKNDMCISLYKTYKTELYIANRLIFNKVNTNNNLEVDIGKYRKNGNMELTDDQLEAIKLVAENNICIINGYSGVGKSTSVKSILDMLDDQERSYLLLAPTGVASKVLEQSTGRKASTIHRQLHILDMDNDDVPPIMENVVFIDETSMVDIFLFEKVLKAIDFSRTKLVLIGDNAQIPSISCGNLFHDLIESDLIPKKMLTKVFRYGEGGLMTVATDTRNGKLFLNESMIGARTPFGNGDYNFIDIDDKDMLNYIKNIYKKLLELGHKPEDIQVLTSKNVGNEGVDNINEHLQPIANKKNYMKTTPLTANNQTYFVDDYVLQCKNNYSALKYDSENDDYVYNLDGTPKQFFVANGESGVIKKIMPEKKKIIIDFNGEELLYDESDLKDVKLGYSKTIFKMQGGNGKIIILCTPKSHTFMLNSNLIYVGLTRMREKCIHLGNVKTVNMAIKKKANLKRNTYLQEMLKESDKAYEEYLRKISVFGRMGEHETVTLYASKMPQEEFEKYLSNYKDDRWERN